VRALIKEVRAKAEEGFRGVKAIRMETTGSANV
jgi:hypothetical protein